MTDFEISNDLDLTDLVESVLLRHPGRHLGTSYLKRVLSAHFRVEESRFAFVLQTMRRRKAILQDKYPFTVTEGVAVSATSGAPTAYYSTLLLMTPDGVARAGRLKSPPDDMTSLFEEVARDALANLFGSGGRALRFGWSLSSQSGHGFSGAVEWLATELGIQTGAAYVPPRRKDGGVDVVAWRPFGDGQVGFPIVLAQCTVQKNPIAKTSDIELHQWRRWLALDQDPQVALAFPGVIQNQEIWNEMSAANLLLDRFRLSELLPESHTDATVRDATARYAEEVSSVLEWADEL